MPGVPTGKACDACRQQKKKCDAKNPACSRCARLNIACVGGGIQRYKFMPSVFQQKVSQNQHDAEGKAAEEGIVCRSDAWRTASSSPMTFLPMAVHSPLSPLINSFIATIHPSTDVPYNLTWVYGCFLADVPSRLGSDKSLDCATDAVVSAHASLCGGTQSGVSPEARVKYSRALRAFRERLNDSSVLRSSNTLCVMRMLLMCQALFGPAPTGSNGIIYSGHNEGALCILRARKQLTPYDEFEQKVLESLCQTLVRTVMSPRLACLEGLCC